MLMSIASALPREPLRVSHVFRLAWPIGVSMLSYTAMSLSDTVFVSQLGTAALAAVGLGATALFTVQAFGLGVLRGVKINVAHATGAEELALARRLGWAGLWMALGFGVVVAASARAGPVLFSAMGASDEVGHLAQAYFAIRVYGAPLFFFSLALQGFFQGRGDTRTPMVATVIANVLNILLDPVLIFGWAGLPALGIEGAALASVIGHAVGLVYLGVRAREVFAGCGGLPERQLVAEIWEMGLPIGVGRFLDVVSFMAFAAVLARYADAHLAAHILVIRLVGVSFLPGFAVGEATGVLVGQAMGAGVPDQADRAYRAGLQLGVGFMALCGVVFVVVPDVLIMGFSVDEEVAVVSRQLLYIAAIIQLFDAVVVVTYGALQGAGDTRFLMRCSVACAWLVKLPVGIVLALGLGWGAPGAWMGLTLEIGVLAVVMGLRVVSNGFTARSRAVMRGAQRA